MKVKITNAPDSHWYYSSINQEFDIDGISTIHESWIHGNTRHIYWDDCEIVAGSVSEADQINLINLKLAYESEPEEPVVLKPKSENEELIEMVKTPRTIDEHYDNSNGSLYKFAKDHDLNAWEFDIIKRITRCRKKGYFKEDLEKTKRVIDIYLSEYESMV